MYVACSTLCYAKLPLEAALRTMRDLRFAKADLALHAEGPHLTPAEAAADPGRLALKLKASNVGFAAFHLDFGPATPDECRAQLRGVGRLARLLAVPLLTVTAAPAGTDLAAEADRLAELTRLAAADGVMLCVETHSEGVTASLDAALGLCRKVPGLGLTLDPSHFLTQGIGVGEWEDLWPLVRHVRLRDTAKGADKFQVRVGQGELEYGRLVAQLERVKYDRALTVDVRDVADSPFPIEPEVRKLKFLLESLV